MKVQGKEMWMRKRLLERTEKLETRLAVAEESLRIVRANIRSERTERFALAEQRDDLQSRLSAAEERAEAVVEAAKPYAVDGTELAETLRQYEEER